MTEENVTGEVNPRPQKHFINFHLIWWKIMSQQIYLFNFSVCLNIVVSVHVSSYDKGKVIWYENGNWCNITYKW